jgi:hypothetical protein
MVKQFLPLLTLFCAITIASLAQVERITEQQIGISERLQHEIEMTKDPSLGYVPKARLLQAYEVRKNRLNQPTNILYGTPFTWIERGPYIDAVGPSNGNTRPGNGKTAGRVRAIHQDLSDPTGKLLWVGGIDGGLWKTNDLTASPANWVPINDFFGNLAVASICQDPTDHNLMYFGTGEKAINADAVRGAGIWRSTDHGVTWSIMPGTETLWNVSKMVCDAVGNLYVGCNTLSNNRGMQRYTKSTATWTNITPTGLDPRVPDIELSSTGRLHITCGYYNTAAGSSGYRYTDNPATVTSSTWTSPSTTFPTQYNVDLASVGNTLYALPSNASYEVSIIYKSTNGGVNWSATGSTPSALTNGQAWYDMMVAVDPKNANNVIVGGLDCHKSTNGGSSWTRISNWVGTSGQYVHADQQTAIWDMNNQVIIGSDGGIHYSANGGTTFTDRNEGLRIKQFYSVAVSPTSTNYFLGGTQDNGVHQLNGPGLTSSVEVTGGDGAFVHIDQDQPQYQWGSYVYNQYRRSTNGGGSWSSVNISSSAGRFINPTDYDDAANIMYCAGAANAFYRWNAQTASTATSVSMAALNGTIVSAVKVSPYSSNTVFFGGRGAGILPALIKATNANATPTYTSIAAAGMNSSGSYISCIELGSNDQNIIVVFSNYGINNVWVTSNGGSSWTAVDGNLPDMPVRWAMFYPGDNTKAIIATETGVWKTDLLNGASTVWDPETGFPNVRTDMLQYRASDGLLVAATHGRGMFSTFISSAPSCGTVTGLAASSITTNSGTVSWAALSGANNYDVDYKLSSSGTWITAATATTSLSVDLAGLTEGSVYDYRVRANCTDATGAYATAQFTTTTTATCGNVTGLNASSVTTNSATVAWAAVSGALNYDVEYKLNSSGTWTNAATATTNLSVNLSGLSASSLYDYRVRANCTGATGAYSSAQFTTLAPPSECPGIYDISSNGTTGGAATIPLNTDVNGLLNVRGDNDYYRFTITTGGTITITLGTLPTDYQLALLSSSGATLQTSGNSGTISETINRTVTAGTYYARVYPKNNGAFNASLCYTLRVQTGTASLQDLTMDHPNLELKLFPNPSKDKLNVYLLADNTSKFMDLYDANGKRLYSQKVNDMFTTLDIQKLPKGLYLVKIRSEDGKLLRTEKFIKN